MTGNIFRLTYSRDENVKFVSHLDLVHVFERAIRRADLPIAFSNGFNPRMLLVFGNPLPVGLTSQCEMVDIEFTEAIDGDYLVDSLTKMLPPAFKILNAAVLNKPYDNIVKLYKEATYIVDIKTENFADFIEKTLAFYNIGLPIPAIKKSKSGDKEIDVRPLIFNISEFEGKILLSLSQTPEASVKAELCIKAISARIGLQSEIISIHKASVS